MDIKKEHQGFFQRIGHFILSFIRKMNFQLLKYVRGEKLRLSRRTNNLESIKLLIHRTRARALSFLFFFKSIFFLFAIFSSIGRVPLFLCVSEICCTMYPQLTS